MIFRGYVFKTKEAVFQALHTYLHSFKAQKVDSFLTSLCHRIKIRVNLVPAVVIAYILFFICSSWEIAVGERLFNFCRFDLQYADLAIFNHCRCTEEILFRLEILTALL